MVSCQLQDGQDTAQSASTGHQVKWTECAADQSQARLGWDMPIGGRVRHHTCSHRCRDPCLGLLQGCGQAAAGIQGTDMPSCMHAAHLLISICQGMPQWGAVGQGAASISHVQAGCCQLSLHTTACVWSLCLEHAWAGHGPSTRSPAAGSKACKAWPHRSFEDTGKNGHLPSRVPLPPERCKPCSRHQALGSTPGPSSAATGSGLRPSWVTS